MTEFAARLRRLRLRSFVPLILIASALPIAPLSLRVLNRAVLGEHHNISYLPSSEIRRTRKEFRIEPIATLRSVAPRWVFVGDSMLGTRVHPELLGELSEDGTRKVWFLMHAASGPSFWYLSFKNHLVASGVRPRVTFFVFRDTNLTDTMFRLPNLLGDALDEVAHEQEPELDAIVAARQRGAWWRIDRALNAAYDVDTTYAWLHPTVRRWYALWKYPEPETRLAFEQVIEADFNNNFRADLAADIAATSDDVDFRRDVPTSVLPLIMELARRHEMAICFLRVQRRPEGNRPPPQSPALTRYIAEFRDWAEQQGALFHDETGDPEMTLDLYEDGDHVLDRLRYTRILRHRLDPLFR